VTDLLETGLLARCLLHELDHLDGRVYLDRLSASDRRHALNVIRTRQMTAPADTVRLPRCGLAEGRDPGGISMADGDDVRRLALALPEVTEIDSDGFDFRVGNKGFVWSYPERRPGQPRVIRTDIAVLFVGDEAEKQALLLGEPQLFFTAPGYDGWPLVMLRLAEVDVERLAELVTDAWRMRAPAALLAELDEAR
jgi:hypothetical protein